MNRTFFLRPATSDDMMRLLTWANDPAVRAASYNSGQIGFEEHKRWFESKINDENCSIYILTDGRSDYGQVRGDRKDGKVEIDYSVDSNYRGRGYGRLMLKLFAGEYSDTLLYAEVKKDNSASRKVFESLGYRGESREDHICYTLKV